MISGERPPKPDDAERIGMTGLYKSVEGVLERGKVNRPNISDLLGMFHDIAGRVGPHSSATDHLSLVSHFVLLPSRFGHIGVTILPSGLEKGVTDPLRYWVISDTPLEPQRFRDPPCVSKVAGTTLCGSFGMSYKVPPCIACKIYRF